MTFSISVSGSIPTTGDDNQTDGRVTARVQQAVQRFYADLQRSGAKVSSFTASGKDVAIEGQKFAPFEARTAPSAAGADIPPRDNRIQTGQPGAKSALELSIEAGTTSTESQPEPAPTGPVSERKVGAEVNTDGTKRTAATRTTASTTTTKAGDKGEEGASTRASGKTSSKSE